MIYKTIAFLLLFILLCGRSEAQKITIKATDESLSDVLVQLRDNYNLSFSFNDEALQKYRVTVNKSFENTEQALDFITKNLPLNFEKSGDVWIIYPEREIPEPKSKPKPRIISGQILERKTLESLPYTNIVINGQGTISDADGYFSYRSTDSVFNLNISQLGYYRIDTTLSPGRDYQIEMIPAVEALREIVITDRLLETFVYTESRAGVLRMNHKVTKFLPGSSDNSVFNLLRLQSGVLAAAESSDNLIIWGAYEGQSRILFDDFLLFGLKNFNDNISAVNPYVVKDIKLLKAGFNAAYGDCVGGIADITGKDGNRLKPGADLSLNNYTLNTMVEAPVGKNASFLVAFRHTYHELYENQERDFFNRNGESAISDITIVPDYTFRDLNIKYTYRNDQGFHFRTSMLTGQDIFAYNIDEMLTNHLQLLRETSETNLQKGASMVVGKNGKNGWNTKFTMTFSTLDTRYESEQQVVNTFNDNLLRDEYGKTNNTTREITAGLRTQWAINENHQLEAGIEWVANRSTWLEDSSDVTFIDQEIRGAHITAMLQDEISYGNFNLVPGIRITRVPYLGKFYLEPRLGASYKLTEQFSLNIASGLYRQYLSKNSVQDESGNYRFMWTVADDSLYPVLKSQHFTGSITFNGKNTQASISPYFRKTTGLTRYVNFSYQNMEGISQGKGISHGFDLYLKHNFKGHTGWISYTWSETEELFDHYLDDKYRYAPQDQRHEVKIATLLDFDPIYFSANYVYGSGFPILDFDQTPAVVTRTPYIRLDVALIYKFHFSRFYGETGISVLNLFDRENLLYSNLERVPVAQTSSIRIYQQSVPFTPTVYIKIGF
ncbi:FecR domain-containing protein [Salinivirga cyanobacteriivorans]